MPHSRFARYLLTALAIAAAALAVHWALVPWIGWRLPFLVIVPAIIFAAATLGRAPAALVMALGAANAVIVLSPTGSLLLSERADRYAILAYLAVGVLLVFYGGRLHFRSGRAERAEKRLSLAQDETGIGLFELDYRAETAYASPALCKILGQPVMDGSMPLQQWLGALNAEHVAESRRALQEKVSAGELRYERELRIVRPDGTARWLLSRIHLDLDARGELVAARGGTLDITTRKQLVTEREQALSLAEQAQRRFEVALQSSSVAFTIIEPLHDETGQVVDFAWSYANSAAAAVINRPAEELVGRRILDVLPHAWDEPGSLERYVGVSERGTSAEFETQTLGPGPRHWLHVILSPLGGSVVVWFADVSQRRQEQQALREADLRKDQFLATLAHELRNPLAPIRQAVGIVRDQAVSEPQRQRSLAVIERQLRHMALLLDDLLDVSRVTRGNVPLRREHGTLQALVETAVETARPVLDARAHRLVLDLPEQAVALHVDPLRIAQVLGNLLVNAAKYTEPGGRIVLSGRCEADELVLAVSDDGRGLRPEDCERVFEMFTQLPIAPGGVQAGLGIGLALARNLAQMHGGRLDAYSAGPGQGSTFTLRLPTAVTIDADPGGPAVHEKRRVGAGAPPSVSTARRRRILIADDNRDAADTLAILLTMDGHEVNVAYNGPEALALYRQARPEVALLDVGMPGHTGDELASMIRNEQGTQPIMLVAITGFGQPSDCQRALDAGFDHHMTKPIEHEQLLLLIDEVPAAAAQT